MVFEHRLEQVAFHRREGLADRCDRRGTTVPVEGKTLVRRFHRLDQLLVLAPGTPTGIFNGIYGAGEALRQERGTPRDVGLGVFRHAAWYLGRRRALQYGQFCNCPAGTHAPGGRRKTNVMLTSGTRLGSYEIVSLIGAGGMGEVYRARDSRLNRQVAIRVLPEGTPHAGELLERLRGDARLVALNHPHICALHDVGPDYVVMEYVEGIPLPLPLTRDKVVEYALQILDALGAAHAKGIVHRDLKPSNLLLTDRGIKVLDFGFARVAAADEDQETEELTRAATLATTIASTPEYMAPEQSGGATDHRSDIYAFGCVLYEMLTGERVTVPRAPLADGGLESVVARCLAAAPDNRFQSAAEAAAAIRAVAGSPRRWPWMAAAAVVLLAVAGAVWQLFRPTPVLRPDDVIVVAEFENATGEPLFDAALQQALTFELQQSPLLRLMDDTQVLMALRAGGRPVDAKVTREVARDVCVRAGARATLEGSIARAGSRYLVGLHAVNCRTGESLAREQGYAGDTDAVVETLAAAATAIRRRLGERLPAVAGDERQHKRRVPTTSLEALQAFHTGDDAILKKGDRAAAIPFYERAVQLDPNFAMAWAVFGLHTRALGDPVTGKEYVEKARSLADRTSERERLFIEALYHDMNGNEDQFIAIHEVLTRTFPNDFIFRTNLAARYLNRGQWEKALAEAAAAIRIAPTRPNTYGLAAQALTELERYADAKQVLQRAIAAGVGGVDTHRLLLYIATAEQDAAALEEELAWFKTRPPDAGAYRHLANAAAAVGQLRAADRLYAQAQEALGGQRGPNAGAMLQEAASASALLGRCGGGSIASPATPLVTAALCGGAAATTATAEVEKRMRKTGPEAYVRGSVMLQTGRAAEAETLFEDMLRRKVANWGPEYPAAYVGLARAAAATGNVEKAVKTYEAFFAFWKKADDDVPLLLEARREHAALLQR